MSILDDITILSSQTLVTLYELDLSKCIGKFGETTTDVYRWCDGVNELGRDVEWDGQVYTRYPIQTQGFDRAGDGSIPRPKMVVANISGYLGELTKRYNDLTGATLKRTRTFLKYLDASNFKVKNYFPLTTDLTNTTYWPRTRSIQYPVVMPGPVYPNSLLSSNIASAVSTDVSGSHGISIKAITVPSGTRICFSCYIKAGARDCFRLYVPAQFGDGSSSINAYFNLTTNKVTLKSSIADASITEEANGFYRLSMSFVTYSATNATGILQVLGLIGTNDNTAYVGDNNTVDFYITSPQIEYDTIFPKEYVPNHTTTIGNPFADPTQFLDIETWTVDRKSSANSTYIEWELTAPYDIVGSVIPKRQAIQNMCTWKYRSTECGYTGSTYYNINDSEVSLASQDRCGKRLSSCKKRFGETAILNFGGFPALGLY